MKTTELKKLSESNRMLLTTMAVLQLPGMWFLAEKHTLLSASSADADALDQVLRLLDALSLVELGMQLATAIVFIRWMLVLRRNAVTWAPNQIRHTELQMTWAFFIPVINWIWPFQAMMDLWRASSLPGRELPPTLVIRWWTLWIGSAALNFIGSYLIIRTESPSLEVQADSILFTIGAKATLIPCALLAIKLVRTLTLLQRLRTEVEL